MRKTQKIKNRPEILAPAGNFSMLITAVESGADAVYLGIKGLNMRSTAKNFTITELKKATDYCHKKNVKIYITVNTIIFENEIEKVRKILTYAKKYGVDAVICWDFSVINIAKEIGLDFHISTQASISNSESANFFNKLGATRCVLARECSLEELKKIKKKTKIGLEVFAHGAMCVSVSGRCFISQFLYGKSANRGDCIQPCRRAYDSFIIDDKEEEKKLILGNDYVMSPKDLCTLPFLDKLVPYVDSLKIEGRGKNTEYVKRVVGAYREAIDSIYDGTFTEEFITKKMEELREVYNRGFSDGFYMGKPITEFTNEYGSKSKKRKYTLGRVKNFYKKINVAEIEITANNLKKGDTIMIIGNKTGLIEQTIENIVKEDQQRKTAKKGDVIGIKTEKVVRKNDLVFLWK
ncbi:MAG: peptidase U32 family protein [Nanoarchaeota archaeon]